MRHIRNPIKWWRRLDKLVKRRAEAIRRHRQSEHIYQEIREIQTAIIAYENRQDRRAA